MRDILNLLDTVVITEGVGLANRRPGEQFKNPEGDTITFQGLDFYPESGAVDTPSDLVGLKVDNVDKPGLNVHWINQATGSTRAFMIASFTSEDGQPYYLGKWVKEISPNRALNNCAHSDIPGGFKFASKAGAKENTGYKPAVFYKPPISNRSSKN